MATITGSRGTTSRTGGLTRSPLPGSPGPSSPQTQGLSLGGNQGLASLISSLTGGINGRGSLFSSPIFTGLRLT